MAYDRDVSTGDAIEGAEVDEWAISDAELTALALASDPDDVEIALDAVPFGAVEGGATLLPAWYMPTPLGVGSRPRGRKAVVVSGIVLALLAVNATGLCITYGIPEVGDRVSSFFG